MKAYRAKAFVYQGRPGAVTRETITLTPGPRDLLVKVVMCARCGTDKTIYRSGHSNVDPYAPVVLGHELVARVVLFGVEQIRPRERVAGALQPVHITLRGFAAQRVEDGMQQGGFAGAVLALQHHQGMREIDNHRHMEIQLGEYRMRQNLQVH